MYPEEEAGDGHGTQEEHGGHEVRKGERELLPEWHSTEYRGELLGRLGEETSKCWAEYGSQRPDKRHHREGDRLQFLLGNQFGNHGSYDSNYAQLANMLTLPDIGRTGVGPSTYHCRYRRLEWHELLWPWEG